MRPGTSRQQEDHGPYREQRQRQSLEPRSIDAIDHRPPEEHANQIMTKAQAVDPTRSMSTRSAKT